MRVTSKDSRQNVCSDILNNNNSPGHWGYLKGYNNEGCDKRQWIEGLFGHSVHEGFNNINT